MREHRDFKQPQDVYLTGNPQITFFKVVDEYATKSRA